MFDTDTRPGQPGSRRAFIVTAAAAITGTLFYSFRRSVFAATKPGHRLPATVKLVEFDSAGKKTGTNTLPTITRTEDEWRQQLSPDAYEVARNAGTERPYTGDTWDEHGKGVYRCICCSTALFNANTKFDSHTGWPSFWQPIARENVREDQDTTLGMTRTAVSCPRCDAHLGHVFNDGPPPTGLRYCMNSAAMHFEKQT